MVQEVESHRAGSYWQQLLLSASPLACVSHNLCFLEQDTTLFSAKNTMGHSDVFSDA